VPLLAAGNAGAVPLDDPIEVGLGLNVDCVVFVDFLDSVGFCFCGETEVADTVAVWYGSA
jgi:hypothetical protein